MLSDRQKSVLFKTRIVSKPRYVRVPLQMYNGVRELKTDVYFPRLLQQYQQNIELMQRLLPDERICHLRADVHGIKDWQRTYERFTCAFRSLNPRGSSAACTLPDSVSSTSWALKNPT